MVKTFQLLKVNAILVVKQLFLNALSKAKGFTLVSKAKVLMIFFKQSSQKLAAAD